MELQSVSTQSNAITAYTSQQQAVRPPDRNQSTQNDPQDAETRVADRVTLSPESRPIPDPLTAQTQQPTQAATVNRTDEAERPNRPEENEKKAQAQDGNRPPPHPQSVAHALQAYTQATVV